MTLFPVMAAKEAIFELLKDCSLSKEDLTENILTCVRQHKLGTVPIARYAKEALKLDNLDSERFGLTVESHVRAMVDVARSTDTHGSQNRGTVDDDVTVDLDSDNLDEDECIEELDSDMARGSAKARSLARASIAEADHQKKGGNGAENDNQPVGDGEKPEDNAYTEDVRPTSGDANIEATVSAHSQTLDVLKQIMETLEREREESRNREDRLNRQIKDLSGKLQHLTTQVEKQAKIINEERSAAQDRETRMKNKVQDIEKIVRELSGSVGDVLKTQANALRENKEKSAKIARQLNDLKELSTPHTKNDTSAVPHKPTTNPREDAKSTNQKAEDEPKRKSGPSSPEKKQRGRADFEPCQRTSSWPDESDKTCQPWADESEVVQHSGTQPQLEYLTEPFIGHHLMLIGDFNVDFLNPMDTNYSHLQSMCIVHGLSNCVQSPTRFSPTSSRCIDLILGNFSELSQATVDHVDFTDHALISSSLNTTVEKKHQAMETTRRTWPSREKLSSATSDFQHVLQFYMQTLPTGVDVDNIWEEWKQRFNTALDEVAPGVTKVHSHKRRHCPWMTKELLNLIHKQKSLHQRIVKSAHKNSELIARHRALRNKTNNHYRRLRNSRFKERLLLYRTSPRQLWTTIKYITNKQRLPLQVSVPPGPAHTVGSIGSGPDQLFRFFFFLSSLEANVFARGLKLNKIEHYKLDESKSRCPRETFFVSRFSPAFRMLEEDTRVSATSRHLLSIFHVSYIYKTHSGPQCACYFTAAVSPLKCWHKNARTLDIL